MCDWLSRTEFDSLLDDAIGDLAEDAFSRMDQQLDLTLQQLLFLDSAISLCAEMYVQNELSDLWKQIEEFQAILLPIPKIGKNTQKEEFELFFKTK